MESKAAELPGWVRAVARAAAAMLAAAFLAGSLFVAVVLPYRSWDSLAFGSWSRLIEQTGHVLSGVSAADLNRPLFYVTQGLAWRLVGYHEWLGRSLSVAFSAGFVIGVWLVAARLARGRDGRELLRTLAVGVALASSVFATYVAAGMTDVPVAATSALAAAALWSRTRASARIPLVAGAAAATALSKPTGFVALAGIGLAAVVLALGEGERRRLVQGLASLGLGAATGLAYNLLEARRLHESLYAFLHAGNTDYYLSQGNAQRFDRILRADWLGSAPRLLVLFGLLYAVARVGRARTRLALALAGPGAIAWSVGGPVAADGGAPYPFHGGLSLGLLAYLVVAAALLAAPLLAVEDTLGRASYAALLLWLAPGAVVWIAFRSDEVRFLSPAWPALVLLTGAALTTVARALARLQPALALAPVLAVALLAVANLTSIDGLGGDGWRGLRDLGFAGWGDRARVENYAYGPFSYELDLARANVGTGQRIVSSDGRLRYFFPRRVSVSYASSCADLRDARYFALLTGGESADIAAHLVGAATDPLAWLQCRAPRLTLVGAQPGIYASFVVGTPARAPTPGDCHISTSQGELLDAVFADGVPYAAARDVRARAAAVGFGAHIEQTACNAFRVVVTGIPEPAASQADFRNEAKRVGFDVKIVPPVRYPEVAPDVPPAPESR